MERIRIATLQAGQSFDRPLFSLTGQKLLNGGTPLSPKHIEAIRRCGDAEVVCAESVEELVSGGIVAHCDSSQLRVGQKVDGGFVSRGGHMVVEPGERIEEHHLDALAAGGGGAFAPKNPAAAQRRERVILGDTVVESLEAQMSSLQLHVTPQPDAAWIQPGHAGDWPSPEKLTEWRDGQVNLLRSLFARIEAGLAVKIEQVTDLTDELLRRLALYPTRFTQLALLCPRREDYLPDHAYTVTVLAMAIAARLNWPVDDVRHIGRAGLVYDLGMLMVPERIRSGACELTDIDRSRVQRHPVFSLAMLQTVEGVPPIIQLAAYQHHERENGSGYPTGARREALCDYARVLAVADCFAATTEPRHYRKPKLPYTAMEETLRSTATMALWKPAVRALLSAAGLFPVGSYVKLSSGKSAHIIACNPAQLDRPTVQVLTEEGGPDGPPIDLMTVPPGQLTVVRPIHSPKG
ncbi:MAG: HD domain-containing protein [Planctomycetota bacterium]|nr:HD domain-containing protein [Planctomycetota bacterium]